MIVIETSKKKPSSKQGLTILVLILVKVLHIRWKYRLSSVTLGNQFLHLLSITYVGQVRVSWINSFDSFDNL